jgi:hypothetical protein
VRVAQRHYGCPGKVEEFARSSRNRHAAPVMVLEGRGKDSLARIARDLHPGFLWLQARCYRLGHHLPGSRVRVISRLGEPSLLLPPGLLGLLLKVSHAKTRLALRLGGGNSVSRRQSWSKSRLPGLSSRRLKASGAVETPWAPSSVWIPPARARTVDQEWDSIQQVRRRRNELSPFDLPNSLRRRWLRCCLALGVRGFDHHRATQTPARQTSLPVL